MENNSEIIYKLPETPKLKEYYFKEKSLSIEGDSNPQPPSHTQILILPVDPSKAYLTYRIGGISSYSRGSIKQVFLGKEKLSHYISRIAREV